MPSSVIIFPFFYLYIMTTSTLITACPVCQENLQPQQPLQKQWGCSNAHSFDVSRYGYVNLLLAQHKKSKSPGDTQDMVDARQRVLNSKLYQPISDWLNQWLIELLIERQRQQQQTLQIADIGCGEGYYTQRLHQVLQDHQIQQQLYGVDISKEALKRAAKRSKDIHWLVASGGLLPFQAHSLDLIVCLFTNLMPEGFAKVLKQGAPVVLLNTGKNHLLELRQQIYQEVKLHEFNPIEKMQQHGYRLTGEQRLSFKTELSSNEQILDVLRMTPHWWKVKEQALERLKQLEKLSLSFDIVLHQFNYDEIK